MLTIKEIKTKYNIFTECSSCGKSRKRYYEIRYGIPGPWSTVATIFYSSALQIMYQEAIRKHRKEIIKYR